MFRCEGVLYSRYFCLVLQKKFSVLLTNFDAIPEVFYWIMTMWSCVCVRVCVRVCACACVLVCLFVRLFLLEFLCIALELSWLYFRIIFEAAWGLDFGHLHLFARVCVCVCVCVCVFYLRYIFILL
jgi:hypothetical protein